MARKPRTPSWSQILCGVLAVWSVVNVEPMSAVAQIGDTALSRITQADLQALGFEPGVIDGRWGRQSLQALRRFQRAEGLPETGRADPETVARLRQRRQPVTATAQPEVSPAPVSAPKSVPQSLSIPSGPVDASPIPEAMRSPDASVGPSPVSTVRPTPVGGGGRASPNAVPVDVTRADNAQSAPSAASGTRPRLPTADPSGTVVGAEGTSAGKILASWMVALLPVGLVVFGGLRRRRRKRHDGAATAIAENGPGATRSGETDSQGGAFPAQETIAVPPSPSSTPAPETDLQSSDVVSAPEAPATATAIMPPPAATAVARLTFGTRTSHLQIPPVLTETSPVDSRPTNGAARRHSSGTETPSPHRVAGDRAWVPAGERMTVAGFDLPGLVYVGRLLKRSDGYGRNDNCLIDPGLTVSRTNADTIGQHMDYWPAYESMHPSSRRALLEWLSGGRSDPDTYVGYVFVYLYGLERRGILERSREDQPSIRAEVERLISVYGNHDSFQRYASEFLSALDILDLTPGRDPAPVFLPSGGDVPPAVRIAVGSRIRDGRPVEADWLLAWTMSHPETRVRTPARRAFDHLRAEFAAEFDRRHPSGGLRLKAGKGKAATLQYRAASGSFTVGIEPDGMDALPDLSRFPKALATGRELLEICTDGLDAYSRQLGKGGVVTLRALALLPPGRRERAAGEVAGEDLDWLRTNAASGVSIPFHDLGSRISGQSTDKATPAKLRDLGDTLCRFGMGLIPDPRFPARLPPSSYVMLFRLDAPSEAVEAPSDAYKAAFLALSVGMLVAKADGEVAEDERTVLRDLASASPDLTSDERRRLLADALWLETHPAELPTLRARLSELGLDQRQAVGATLVRVASSDGSHHRAEIALLEKAFRHMGLDQNQLYAALHQAAPAPGTSGKTPTGADDPVRVALGTEHERTYAIPGAPVLPGRPSLAQPSAKPGPVASSAPDPGRTTPLSAGRVDAERLAAIRAETIAVSSVLSDVFDLDADGPPSDGGTTEAVTDPEETEGTFSGLDPRHARLLRELVERPDWPRTEFDRLAREFGLMPGAAMENLNAWAFDRFDDLLVEEGDPVHVNLHLIPDPLSEAA